MCSAVNLSFIPNLATLVGYITAAEANNPGKWYSHFESIDMHPEAKSTEVKKQQRQATQVSVVCTSKGLNKSLYAKCQVKYIMLICI